MSTILGFVVGLLQSALSLLGFVQTHPDLPQAQHDQAVQVAQQAITTATNAIQSNSKPTSGVQTYTNTQYGFSIQYPNTVQVTNKSIARYASGVPIRGDDLFQATYKGDTVDVVVSADPKDVASCGSSKSNGIVTIGGVAFSSNTSGDIGAGQELTVTSYETIRGGTCYRIVKSMIGVALSHLSGTELQQEQVARNQMAAVLDSIIHSFKFTDSTSTVSVPGMEKYTDPDFGFSFWYPSRWVIAPSSDVDQCYGPAPMKSFSVSNAKDSFIISEYISSSGIKYGCGKADDRVYFDSGKHAWMDFTGWTEQEGLAGAHTDAADVSKNTMGGLHMIWNNLIPLSAQNFVLVEGKGTIDDLQLSAFTKTIVATDPSVATPVSAAEQIKVIQAEKDAYAGQ